MTTLTLNPFQKLRIKAVNDFNQGIKPVDGRQPIPDEVALAMIQELDVPKDALIGVYDAFLILTSHLREQGYTNIVVLETVHKDLTSLQQKYYDSVKSVCDNSPTIKYYVPPMNNYNRCDMKFDVIIGNPPYQNDKKNGAGTGSGHSALYLDFVEKSYKLLKDNGIISLITPSGIFCGSESKTKMMVGKKAIYSTKFIDFNINQYFKIGQDVCRWVAQPKQSSVITQVADGREIDLINATLVTKDAILSDIVSTLVAHQGPKVNFSFSGAYVVASIEDKLRRQGVENPDQVARNKSKVATETNPYACDFNGKTFYMQVKPAKYDLIRIFAPQLTNPTTFKFETRQNCGNAGATYVMEFDTWEDAEVVEDILNNPIYLWIVNSLRIDGRLNKTYLNTLPNAPIEEVLTADQLSYIQSQL